MAGNGQTGRDGGRQVAAQPMSAVVTGASSGLGLVAANALAAAGHHTVLACRDVNRGKEAAKQIRDRTPDASLEVLEMDLATLASVQAAAQKLRAGSDRPPLRAVICNAGVQVVEGIERSADGYELTFATNHLGHYLLVRLLLEQIVEPGRIVVVSSGTHYGPPKSAGFPAPRWEDPHALADPRLSALDDSGKSGRIRYATSKLANIYFTHELARRLGTRDITVNAFDPGLMPQTGLHRNYPATVQRLYSVLAPLIVRAFPGARSVADSGATLAWLATDPSVAGVTGRYFVDRKARKSSPESYDQARAAKLWDDSARFVEHAKINVPNGS